MAHVAKKYELFFIIAIANDYVLQSTYHQF
jgi:hypothetical protein